MNEKAKDEGSASSKTKIFIVASGLSTIFATIAAAISAYAAMQSLDALEAAELNRIKAELVSNIGAQRNLVLGAQRQLEKMDELNQCFSSRLELDVQPAAIFQYDSDYFEGLISQIRSVQDIDLLNEINIDALSNLRGIEGGVQVTSEAFQVRKEILQRHVFSQSQIESISVQCLIAAAEFDITFPAEINITIPRQTQGVESDSEP